MTKPFYRIQWFCPVCDKPHETIGHLIPRPHLNCGDCLMNRVQVIEMVIESAEQLPQPGTDGEYKGHRT